MTEPKKQSELLDILKPNDRWISGDRQWIYVGDGLWRGAPEQESFIMPIPTCDDCGDSLVVTTLPCECKQPKRIERLDFRKIGHRNHTLARALHIAYDKINELCEVIDRLNELTKLQNIGD